MCNARDASVWDRIADVFEAGVWQAYCNRLYFEQELRKCPCGHSIAEHQVWTNIRDGWVLWVCQWESADGEFGCFCAHHIPRSHREDMDATD